MSSPPPLPLFVPEPEQNPPPPQPAGRPWVWVVVAGVVVMAAVLVALALPTYRLVRQKAQVARSEQMEGLKPKRPLTQEDKKAAAVFGEKLAAAVSASDIEFLVGCMNVSALADRVFLPLGTTGFKSHRLGFISGFQRNRAGFFSNMLGSDAKTKGFAERDGFPAVRLRIVSEDGGVRFLDVLLEIDGKAEVEVIDAFTFEYGSYVSTESRQTLVTLASSEPGNPLVAMFTGHKADPAKLETMRKMNTSRRLGRYEEVVLQYEELPAALQKDRVFFIFYLQAVQALPMESPTARERYREVLSRAPTVLGKYSTAGLLQVDLQYLDGDYAGAEGTLRDAEGIVGRDAYLTRLRAEAMLQQNKVQEAECLEREAAAMEPDLPGLLEVRMRVNAVRRDYPAMVKELRAFKAKNQVGLTRAELAGPEFEAFLKSPEYAKWETENP